MYFVRTPCEWGMDAISATLTFLWEVVGYVEGLFFKDLKQTMKKEQCEVKLLVTASMPGRTFYCDYIGKQTVSVKALHDEKLFDVFCAYRNKDSGGSWTE